MLLVCSLACNMHHCSGSQWWFANKRQVPLKLRTWKPVSISCELSSLILDKNLSIMFEPRPHSSATDLVVMGKWKGCSLIFRGGHLTLPGTLPVLRVLSITGRLWASRSMSGLQETPPWRLKCLKSREGAEQKHNVAGSFDKNRTFTWSHLWQSR